MSHDAFRPITTEQRLPAPFNGTLYITEREVAAEKPAPEIGSTMEAELGDAWADSTVVSSATVPKQGKRILRIAHARIPGMEAQEATNFEFTSVDIGGERFAGVSRTYIYPRADFDEDAPAAGAEMPVGPDDKFAGLGYILVKRSVISAGSELEPVFIAERRDYVKRREIRQIDTDQGVVLETVEIYHRGQDFIPAVVNPDETIETPAVKIEEIFVTAPTEHFGEQPNGTVINGVQISEDWFQIVRRYPYPHGPAYHGSRKNRELGVPIPYTTQVVAAPSLEDIASSSPDTTYEPIDAARSRKTIEAAPTEALNSYHMHFPSRASLRVPPILTAVDVIWNTGSSAGEADSDHVGEATGDTFTYSANDRSSASASVALMPEISATIKEVYADNLPSEVHFLFLPLADATRAGVLAKLSSLLDETVAEWPVFVPQRHEIVLKGHKESGSVAISANGSVSRKDGATVAYGNAVSTSTSGDVNPSTRVVTLPATIHGAISFTNASHPAVEADAEAEVAWTGWGGFPSVNRSISKPLSAAGSVSPTSLSATSPATVPSSGIYLINCRMEYYDYGYVKVFAETVDASVIPL